MDKIPLFETELNSFETEMISMSLDATVLVPLQDQLLFHF